MHNYDYDLLVIGAGSGGVRAARMAATQGMLESGDAPRVAVVEKGALGGTCVNVGCVPKKLMVYASHVSEVIEEAKGFAWDISGVSHDWPAFIARKNEEISRLNGIYANLLRNSGVELIAGFARFIDARTLEVGDKQYTAEKILIAVGGKPRKPALENIDALESQGLVINSDDVFYLDALPKSIVIVGGGYIALEFAGILHGLGASVDVVYRGEQLLRSFDTAIGERLLEQMQAKGIRFHLNENIASVEAKDNASACSITLSSGVQLDAAKLFYATGRVGLSDALGLENVGIDSDAQGVISVNERFQTVVPSIYALGDIIGTPALTPVALEQAMVFVDQQYGNNKRSMVYEAIPTAVFTQPNIAAVGLTEQEALAKGLKLDIYQSDFKHMKHSLTSSQERVFMKLIVEQGTELVLGMHMLGADAGEIIQGFALAVKCGLKKSDIDSVIGIHPTAAEEFVTMRQLSYSVPE